MRGLDDVLYSFVYAMVWGHLLWSVTRLGTGDRDKRLALPSEMEGDEHI